LKDLGIEMLNRLWDWNWIDRCYQWTTNGCQGIRYGQKCSVKCM